jgi:hypothetical protein
VRTARRSHPSRLLELKLKINDTSYMEQAIQRIAQALTNTVVKERYGP